MIRNLLAIERNPVFIKYAQVPLFKIFMILLFWVFISFSDVYQPEWQKIAVLTIFFASFFPKYRYIWIFCGMLSLMLQNLLIRPEPDWVIFRANYLFLVYKNNVKNYFSIAEIKYFCIFLMLLISETQIFFTSRFQQFRLFRYPITISYMFLLGLILTASSGWFTQLQTFLLWSFIAIYDHYYWFVAYTLHECLIIKKRNYLLDYGRYLPVWGFTLLPYGKGSLYLMQVEAKNSEELAVTQLKGMKLALWALILYFVLQYYYQAEDYLKIPHLHQALAEYENGVRYSVILAWTCLIDKFFRMMLELTVMGHFFVACCRMCGFRILRNTYKPLQSPSIAEYWNRYNYYFKELLVDLFFYPTFFRFFRNHSKTRMFFATLSAATFGNVLFHFLLLTPIMMSFGLREACKGFLPFVFYAVILGVSIGLSQLHTLYAEKKPKNIIIRIFSPFFVIIFYSLLSLFNVSFQHQSIMVNFQFLASLFNIKW
jgi:hypothetical protein